MDAQTVEGLSKGALAEKVKTIKLKGSPHKTFRGATFGNNQ